MRKILISLFIIIVIVSCNQRKPNQVESQIVEGLKKANNERNYKAIKPFLSNDFHFDNSDINTSFRSLYSYLNFKLSVPITKIELDYAEEINDSLIRLTGTMFFENNKRRKLNIKYRSSDQGPEVISMGNIQPPGFTFVERASYVNKEIIGDNPVSNIEKLCIIDKSTADSISEKGYTVFFDNGFRKESEKALSLFISLDSILLNTYQIHSIEKEDLYLISVRSNNTVTIGKNRNIPWTMPLFESDSINSINLTNKIGNTFSHEIIEGTLVHKYNLKGYKYRWFRDGLSEFIAYNYCKTIAPKEAERYYVENRLAQAREYKGSGNLLDWRGNGSIKDVDKGKLYGSEFIYLNEVGQYGRSFKFFKDLFERNNSELVLILREIKETNQISSEKVLDIMSSVTNKDIRQLISEY